MQTDKVVFDTNAKEWAKRQKSPWSKLRYELALRNIIENIDKEKSLKILDSGGGNGLDSLPLAKLGHKVTLLDYSQEMIDLAKSGAKKLNISDKVNYIIDDVENVDKHFENESFELVMLHNVLSYVENPRQIIKKNLKVLKPNGIFSLMQVNVYSEVYYPAVFENNLDLSLEKLDAKETTANLFGAKITRFSAEELVSMVEKEGLTLVKRFGISCLNTFVSNNEIKSDKAFYNKLKQLEIIMCDRFPYYHVARFNHLIFRKFNSL